MRTAGEVRIKPSPRVVVECLSCAHTAILPVRPGDDLALVRLTKRFVCTQCGSRAVKAQRRA